jgi:uncharacterized protein Yka (UPF0111/DUF47 family)
MADGEKLITQELEKLEKEMTPISYCAWGKWIRFINGPASDKFSQHIDDCGQCSQALEWERAEPRQ